MLAAYRLRVLNSPRHAARSLRFENLETRLPAAADFNWPEVVGMGRIETAALESAVAPAARIAAPVSPASADAVFAALDACGDLLNVVGRTPTGDSDTLIGSALLAQ